MKTTAALFLAAVARLVSADGVTGAAEGFAKGVTGGGSATAVYPTTTDELVSYLGDDTARVIILDGTYDFTNTEGTTTSTGCAPWGTASACQVAINQNDCELLMILTKVYQTKPDYPRVHKLPSLVAVGFGHVR